VQPSDGSGSDRKREAATHAPGRRHGPRGLRSAATPGSWARSGSVLLR
jgi:hypothetical protein